MLIAIVIFFVSMLVFLFVIHEVDWREREKKLRDELTSVKRRNKELQRKSRFLL
jgi:F0F1-type ATP synthase membrane subunit b/b'